MLLIIRRLALSLFVVLWLLALVFSTADAQTIPPLPEASAQFFVAADGAPHHDGSRDAPWDLATALAQPQSVKPGATIWLLDGLYRGDFVSKLSGAEGEPITLRQFPGARAVLDGSLTVNGAWARYWGFEVMNSAPERTGTRPTGVNVFGPHTQFINLIVHDTGNGFGFWTPARDAEIYGTIIFNNGWQGPGSDRGHGHGIYMQNKDGVKRVIDNILFNQYGWGIHAYTEGGDIKGMLLEGNVSFNNGAPTRQNARYDNFLVGGLRPSERITLTENISYHPIGIGGNGMRLGYANKDNQDLVLTHNYLVGDYPLKVQWWQQVTALDNTIYGRVDNVYAQRPPGALDLSTYVWNRNRYVEVAPSSTSATFQLDSRRLLFSEWQTVTGFDSDSRLETRSASSTDLIDIFVRPNQYESGRAHITVYNPSVQPEAWVDLSGILTPGDTYVLRDVQNYFAPVRKAVYLGGAISLPLGPGTVTPPIGHDGPIADTGPTFKVFVLTRSAAAPVQIHRIFAPLIVGALER
jgi:hypothetical protein